MALSYSSLRTSFLLLLQHLAPESVAGAGRAHLAPDRSWGRKAKAALSGSDQGVGRPLAGPQGESLLGVFQFLLFPLQGACEYTGLPGQSREAPPHPRSFAYSPGRVSLNILSLFEPGD